MTTAVKICGITRLEDALASIRAGAHAIGFVFYRPSPRYIAPQDARAIIDQLPESVLKIGVFVNEDLKSLSQVVTQARLSAVQLHGNESPAYCRELAPTYVIKAFGATNNLNLEGYDVDAIMLDTKDDLLHGGTGRVFDWSIAQRATTSVPKLFLAGGLSPENVAEAITRVRPYAVDACSSLETRLGKKNHERVRAFIKAVRSVEG